MSIAVVYGSTTGCTAEAAEKIAQKLGADCFNVADVSSSQLSDYSSLVLGSSTWGMGDLQDDWESFLPQLEGMNLNGKKVAVFGCGDHIGFGDTFAMALVKIRDAAANSGATIVGSGPIEGYDGVSSEVVEGGNFVGLALDAQNQPELTDARIDAWCAALAGVLA